MIEEIKPEVVQEVFVEARACAGAANCKKVAEALCTFYGFDNQDTDETGEGPVTFFSKSVGPCPNQNQLFCQDPIVKFNI